METTILEVSEDGLEVSLMDGSTWAISPGDSTKTSCWYSTQRIKIEKKGGSTYLINLDTSVPDKVKAS